MTLLEKFNDFFQSLWAELINPYVGWYLLAFVVLGLALTIMLVVANKRLPNNKKLFRYKQRK